MRLFVAVDLSDELRRSISKVSAVLGKVQGIKPVEVENLHVTLMFLGEVADRKVEAVKKALSEISLEPFEMELKGIGFFPPRGSPRVIWVGIDEGRENLRMLSNNIAERLGKLGFRRDKEFAAHVTVGRVKRKVGNLREELKDFENEEFGRMIVKEFKLKQSILKPTGPLYKDLEVYKAKLDEGS